MTTGAPTNGSADLTVVQLNQAALVANPTTFGRFAANLPSQANAVAAADLPSANAATAKYTAKSSLVAYDNLGAPVTLDVYMTKTGPNTWEAAVYNRADAATGGGFPYASASLTTSTLAFSATDGKLTSPPSLTVAIPGGQSTTIDISKTTQLAASYSVADQTLNGNAPSQIDRIEIGTDGTLATIYRDGTRIESFRIPLGNVVSPDRLTNLDGNAFAESLDSGGIVVGLANQANLGKIISSSLENSTVDLGNELTRMIEAQRGYTANSKVFQSSAELLDVLIKLPI
jgi:flagellar hook protein FlgE